VHFVTWAVKAESDIQLCAHAPGIRNVTQKLRESVSEITLMPGLMLCMNTVVGKEQMRRNVGGNGIPAFQFFLLLSRGT
jgi:hypothetical protein